MRGGSGVDGGDAVFPSSTRSPREEDGLRDRPRVLEDFGAGVAEACADAGFGRVEAVAATGRHYALVAAKDGGPAAFVDRREATKLPDTHLKTWESKSKS